MREIDRLRQEIVRSERLAQRKINRIKRDQGIESLGRHNPIRRDAPVQRYTRAQAESYLSQLSDFRSRSTVIETDASGRVISPKTMKAYNTVFRARKKQEDAWYRSVKKQVMESKGKTLEQIMKATTPDHPWMHNPSVNPVHDLQRRKPSSFTSEKAMKKYIRDQQKKVSSDFMGKTREGAMKNLDAIFKDSPEHFNDLVEKLSSLNDKQFYTLWNVRQFMDSASIWYSDRKKRDKGDEDKDEIDKRISVEKTSIDRLIDDARKLKVRG